MVQGWRVEEGFVLREYVTSFIAGAGDSQGAVVGERNRLTLDPPVGNLVARETASDVVERGDEKIP